jgi:hypothetical protein
MDRGSTAWTHSATERRSIIEVPLGASPANSVKSRSATGRAPPSAVRWACGPTGNSVRALDEAVVSRLRQAIGAQAGGEEEQLNGVLRMLGAEIPAATQVPLFGQGPAGQAPKS